MARHRIPAAAKRREVVPAQLPNAHEWADAVESLPLTVRQREIVQLILQAKQQKEIAQQLGISRHTVHAYMRQIFARLGVAGRAEMMLAVFARRLREQTSP